jgi:hypothetical protein
MPDAFEIQGDPEPELVAVDHATGPNQVVRTWGSRTDSSAGLFAKSPAPKHVHAGPSANRHTDPFLGRA